MSNAIRSLWHPVRALRPSTSPHNHDLIPAGIRGPDLGDGGRGYRDVRVDLCGAYPAQESMHGHRGSGDGSIRRGAAPG